MPVLDPAMQVVMERIAARRAGLPNRYALAFPEARSQLLFEREPWLADGPACVCADRDTVLFSFSDRPVQQALGLWREARL